MTAGMLAGTLTLTITVTSAGALLAQREALHGAADAAALGAADALFGYVEADPCATAAKAAAHNSARLSSCVSEDTSVTVRVERWLLGVRVIATARAGLPEG